MSLKSENNHRIAKNTLMLYVRMLFSMLVSLYTSRVILNALGVEDYGIYNVVGGFVGMLGFLNVSMSGATSRFISYELGRNNSGNVSKIFSSSLIIHVGIALFIFILCETIGVWFIEYKLVIPSDKMYAARIVYQFIVITTALNIIQTPYSACIMAHEKFDIYAYVEIVNVVLKLTIAFITLSVVSNRLVIYGFLLFLVGCGMMGFYIFYCIHNFKESHFRWIWDKVVLRKIVSFCGWDLYGNASVIARTQGITVLLNLFFGPIVNAAAGISTQVQGAVMGFGSNVVTAFRPQIIKQYAAGNHQDAINLLRTGMKITSLLLSIVTIPLIVELNFVIGLWLGLVPEYVIPICSCTLIFNFFTGISLLLATLIHATGRVKRISLINGSLYLAVLPMSYILFSIGILKPWLPFLINIIAIFIGVLSNAYTIKLYINEFSLKNFVMGDYLRCLVMFFGVYVITNQLNKSFVEGWARLLTIVMISTSMLIAIWYGFVCDSEMRKRIRTFIISKFSYDRHIR